MNGKKRIESINLRMAQSVDESDISRGSTCIF